MPVFAFLAVSLFSALAFAADAAPVQQWWMVLLSQFLTLFVSIAAPVLSFLAFQLLKKWKVSVELSSVDAIVGKAIGFAEQKAQTALKQGATPATNAEKLSAALTLATTLATTYKLPQKAVEKLESLIEAKLGEHKLAGGK